MSRDGELERLRAAKMQQLQAQAQQQANAQQNQYAQAAQAQQLNVMKEQILGKILTVEARSRLTNIKMVRPDFANNIEIQLIELHKSGRIGNGKLTDEKLKELLEQLQSKRRQGKIRRI